MKKCRVFPILAMLAMFVFSYAQPGLSQTTEEFKALKDEVKALKEGQAAIQKEIQEIKKLLQAKPAPAAPAEFKEAVINIDNAPVKGDKNAKLVLMEFSDYQ